MYGGVGASLALMIMIYAGGHISGAHYNPAVTLAMVIRGKATFREAIAYWTSQLSGAIAAAVIVVYVFQKEGTADAGACVIPDDGLIKALVAELLGTFALVYVILNVATTRGTAGNSFYGIAIAGTVLAMASIVGSYSGGAFNPAVALALSIQKTFCWSQLWIYLIATCAGAVLAALVFNYTNKDDEHAPPIPDTSKHNH